MSILGKSMNNARWSREEEKESAPSPIKKVAHFRVVGTKDFFGRAESKGPSSRVRRKQKRNMKILSFHLFQIINKIERIKLN